MFPWMTAPANIPWAESVRRWSRAGGGPDTAMLAAGRAGAVGAAMGGVGTTELTTAVVHGAFLLEPVNMFDMACCCSWLASISVVI